MSPMKVAAEGASGGFDDCQFSLVLGGPFTVAACCAEVARDTQRA